MRTKNELTAEIAQLTAMIQDKYPELYRSMDENPVTIPNESSPVIDQIEMSEYLEGMIQSLRKMIANQETTKRANTSNIQAPTELNKLDSDSEDFSL